jgi:hypothetical protein
LRNNGDYFVLYRNGGIKMYYEKPKIELIIFEQLDIIRTSYKVDAGGSGGIYDFGDLEPEAE